MDTQPRQPRPARALGGDGQSRQPRPARRDAEVPRHEARERAMCLLYEAELKHQRPSELLAALPARPDAFVEDLVIGVEQCMSRVDELIAGASIDWGIERMPAVDRSTLRLAAFELCNELATPVAVVIDEAVELVKAYSTEDSSRFVNGVLSAIAREVRAGG